MKTKIDADWFKSQHKKTGVTQAEAAALLGRAPTFLTRIYAGDQEMRIGDAQTLSRVMRVPLSEVLSRAGLSKAGDEEAAAFNSIDLAETQTPYEVRQIEREDLPDLNETSNSIQTWTVEADSLVGLGILPGDNLRVDLNAKPRTGDIVVAQLYDWRSGTAQTVIRAYNHPYLVRSGAHVAALKPETVDNERVVIKGVVTLIWRERSVA